MKEFHKCTDIVDAHAQKETRTKLLATDGVSVTLGLPAINVYDFFMDSVAGLPRVIGTLLHKNSAWDFRSDSEDGVTNQYLFQELIDGYAVIDVDLSNRLTLAKQALVGDANKETYPYINKTQTELEAAKIAYSELTTMTLVWAKQRYLKITLHDDLYESKNATLFFTDSIYKTPENLGRPKRLHKAGEYIIDLSGVQRAATLHVNFNINANADCELI